MNSVRDEYPYSVKELALLVGKSTGTVSGKLKQRKPFYGLAPKFKRDMEVPGCPYMIGKDFFLRLQTKILSK